MQGWTLGAFIRRPIKHRPIYFTRPALTARDLASSEPGIERLILDLVLTHGYIGLSNGMVAGDFVPRRWLHPALAIEIIWAYEGVTARMESWRTLIPPKCTFGTGLFSPFTNRVLYLHFEIPVASLLVPRPKVRSTPQV